MNYPESYRYTKEHEWVNLEGDTATVGITFHAQKELGDIVYVDLPKPGTALEKGKSFGSVESVKAVSDIYAPVSGEVTAFNDVLTQEPALVGEDPEGRGWIFKLKISNASELDGLMDAASYAALVG